VQLAVKPNCVPQMNETPGVIVVGGGPCGSFTALNLAKLGRSVTVFEEHSQVGVPSHCAGHLSITGLKRLGLYPLPHSIVENTFCGANFYSPLGKEFSVHFPQPVTCTVNRAMFDEHIAEKAQDAGAVYQVNSRVLALIQEKGFTRGTIIKREEIAERKRTNIVVDAEGISSRLMKEAGLPRPDNLVKGIEVEVENVKNTESNVVDVYLGKKYAPGFYAWLIPTKDGRAKLGLATRTGKPKELLQKLMLKHPAASGKLRSARILKTAIHPITLGGPTRQPYSNGLLVVGDAASQVKPTTGGGVVLGMNCAYVAAKISSEALDKNDFSREQLSKYDMRCREISGFDVKAMLGIRKALDALSDKKMDDAIDLCSRIGLDKTLRNVRDTDFQGQTFLRLLRSPRVLTAVAYFFFAYVSANL
jgi:digeranylgeranylglycerophospholipid reductase